MIDIHFYRKVFDLKQRIMQGELHDQEAVWSLLEEYRRQEPVVYNIETTNACNMHCAHCYRDAGCRAEDELSTAEAEKMLTERSISLSQSGRDLRQAQSR